MKYDKFTCSTQDPGLRRDFIGASDTPIIMGESQWCTPLQLYEIKLGLREPTKMTDAMTRGVELEPVALAEFNALKEFECKPMRMFSARTPCMMANFDGMSENLTNAVEIKCPLNPDFSDEVPKKYYGQIQHQLYVSRHSAMWYYCYHPLGSKSILVKADIDYQKKMASKIIEFHEGLKNFIPPQPTDRDYVKRIDIEWDLLAEHYKFLKNFKDELESQLDEAKDKLIKMCSGQSSEGGGIKVLRSMRKGSIDYLKAFDRDPEELEKYRKESTETWRIIT